MAAIGAIATLLKSGDHVVVSDNTYGGTFRLFDKVLTRYQLVVHLRRHVEARRRRARDHAGDADAVRRDADQPGDAASPTCARRPTSRTATTSRLVVDNTFASPYIQRPIEFGADLVTHSTTKYLNGHSDSVGGIVVAVRDDDIEWLKFVQNAEGAILGPFDSWLVLRGTKTLALRMQQHNANGLALAQFLERAPEGAARLLPRAADASAARAGEAADARLRRHARVRARIARGRAPAAERGAAARAGRKPRRRRDADLASGDDDARVGAGGTARARIGITDGLVRISAGIEDIEDLKDDLVAGARRGRRLSLVDFVLHFDKHLLEFVRDYGSWVYAILFAIVFAETGFVVTPFLPGDSLLFAAGALCATGALEPAGDAGAARRSRRSPATRSTTRSAASSARASFTRQLSGC